MALLSNGQVLAAAGNGAAPLASAELYDPATGTWSFTGSMNVARSRMSATLLPSGKVLVAGGYTPVGTTGNSTLVASAEQYDPATGTWSLTSSMPFMGAPVMALLASGKVLASGFDDSSFHSLLNAELYNPAAATWTPTGSMLSPGIAQAVVLSGGQVLGTGGAGGAINGGSSGGNVSNSAEFYIP